MDLEGFHQLRQAQFEFGARGAGLHRGCVLVRLRDQLPMLVVNLLHEQHQALNRYSLRHMASPESGAEPSYDDNSKGYGYHQTILPNVRPVAGYTGMPTRQSRYPMACFT